MSKEKKGFVRPANPKRIAFEQAKEKHVERAKTGKPKEITNEAIYDMLTDVQNSQIYLVELLTKHS